MPLLSEEATPQEHRDKMEPIWFPFPVAVTRMISKKEAKQIPEAMEAMRKEFARLSCRCWIESDRRSKQEVIKEAKLKGE